MLFVRSWKYYDALIALDDAESCRDEALETVERAVGEASRASAFAELMAAERDIARTISDNARLEVRRIKVEAERLARELQEERDSYLHRLRFKRVGANLHSPEMTIEGVLAEIYDDSIVLRHASTMIATGAVEQLVGDQVIPKHQIGWVTDISGNVRA